jgi:hypothetical protein
LAVTKTGFQRLIQESHRRRNPGDRLVHSWQCRAARR